MWIKWESWECFFPTSDSLNHGFVKWNILLDIKRITYQSKYNGLLHKYENKKMSKFIKTTKVVIALYIFVVFSVSNNIRWI